MKCCLFQSFSLAGRICSRGFTIFWFLPLVFIQFEVMKLLFHAYIFVDFLWLLFLAGRIWPLMRLSISFDLFWNVQRFLLLLLQLNNHLIEVLGSYAGVFRGARLSSLTTNACSTENNIRFPNLDNHIVLSILWKLALDRWVIQLLGRHETLANLYDFY